MKRIYLILMLLLVCSIVFAQAKRFTTSGTITYEKTVNMFATIEKMISKDNEDFYRPMFEEYKKKQPQFKKLHSTLTFDKNESLYKPNEEEDASGGFSNAMVLQNNITYSNFPSGLTTIQKTVYEDKFLLKDSIRHINWKITDERREILGYNCRRANALVMDSVYIVAFYTDEIPLSGGPESFTGLPGMILGLAMPHENITWFATKVVDEPVAPAALKPPVKGKPTDYKKLKLFIQSVMKDWGSYGTTALKGLML